MIYRLNLDLVTRVGMDHLVGFPFKTIEQARVPRTVLLPIHLQQRWIVLKVVILQEKEEHITFAQHGIIEILTEDPIETGDRPTELVSPDADTR